MADDAHEPYRGDYPDVHDEAAASPRWLPALGFAILCVLGLFVAYRAATAHGEAQNVEQGVEQAAQDAEAGDTNPEPAADAPAEPAEGKPPEE